MSLSLTVSEINGDISGKSPIFPQNTVYLAHPLKGFLFELGTYAGAEKLE